MKPSLLSPVSHHSVANLRFSGETADVKSSETPHAVDSIDHLKSEKRVAHTRSAASSNKVGFWKRIGLGMENLGTLYSAGRLNTMAGKAMLAADVLFFMMSFVPLMHFMFLLQPSVIVFLAGAVMNKRIGPIAPKI